MFGLFKKKEAPKAEPAPQSGALKELAAQFKPEELSVLAVTGAAGYSAVRMGDEGLWRMSVPLTAWMEEDSPDIRRGEFQLTGLADDTLSGYLRQRIRGDFILKFKARLSQDGAQLLLLNLPEPGFDPDLKAILEEQTKPDSTYVDGLGTFVLNRQVKWYEAEVDWLDGKVSLSYDKGEPDEMKAAQRHAKALLAEAADWDGKVRALAAGQLLDLANDWSSGEEDGEEAKPITREDFLSRMELAAIQVAPDGGFDFWFDDDLMFAGHSIHVWGTLAGGLAGAQMEG